MQANRAAGMTSFYLGEFPDAFEHLEKAVRLYDPRQHRIPSFAYLEDPGIAARSNFALVLWHLGFLDRATMMAEEAITIARELEHPYSVAYALVHMAALRQNRREPDRVLDLCEEASAIATGQGFSLWQHSASVLRGWALAELGDTTPGIAIARQGLESFIAIGTRAFVSYFFSLIGEAYLRAGEVEDAVAQLARGLEHAEETGEGFAEVELQRLMGAAMATQGDATSADAQKWLDTAVTTARERQDRSGELRVLQALIQLGKEPRPVKARARLEEVYAWFREGFETIDLSNARALIAGSVS
jgi:adenylate cyclase